MTQSMEGVDRLLQHHRKLERSTTEKEQSLVFYFSDQQSKVPGEEELHVLAAEFDERPSTVTSSAKFTRNTHFRNALVTIGKIAINFFGLIINDESTCITSQNKQ